jgi:hypothetical protein
MSLWSDRLELPPDGGHRAGQAGRAGSFSLPFTVVGLGGMTIESCAAPVVAIDDTDSSALIGSEGLGLELDLPSSA